MFSIVYKKKKKKKVWKKNSIHDYTTEETLGIELPFGEKINGAFIFRTCNKNHQKYVKIK